MVDIYRVFLASGAEVDNHESDLYVKDSPAVQALLKSSGYEFLSNITAFRSQIDGTRWLDIPFAFTPFWEKRSKRTA